MAFKYDVISLIELVESKPCIWDTTSENNRNKILLDKSWQEVFVYFEDGYEELCQAEKKKIGEIIMAEWYNIRDTFLRFLRTKSGQGAKQCHIYNDHLQFLLKIAQKDETDSNFSQGPIEEEFVESQPTPSTSQSSSREHVLRSKRKFDDVELEILSQLKKIIQPTEPIHPLSDEELLLLSFLPYIRDMSEVELMDFQMELLRIIKKIKKKE